MMMTATTTTTAMQYPVNATVVGYTVSSAASPAADNCNSSSNVTCDNNFNNTLDEKSRCCCNLMHIKTGAFVVAVLQACGLLLEIVLSVIYLRIGFLGIVLRLAAVILLFLGLKYNRPSYLIFNIVMQIIEMVGFLIVIAYSIYWIVVTANDTRIEFVLIIVASVLGLIIESFFITVLLKCYRYMRQTYSIQQSLPSHLVIVQQHRTTGIMEQQQTIPPPPGYDYCVSAVPMPHATGYLHQHLSAPPPTYAEVTKTSQ